MLGSETTTVNKTTRSSHSLAHINTAVQELCRKIKQGRGRVTDQGVRSEMGGSEKAFLKKCREQGKGHVKHQ